MPLPDRRRNRAKRSGAVFDPHAVSYYIFAAKQVILARIRFVRSRQEVSS